MKGLAIFLAGMLCGAAALGLLLLNRQSPAMTATISALPLPAPKQVKTPARPLPGPAPPERLSLMEPLMEPQESLPPLPAAAMPGLAAEPATASTEAAALPAMLPAPSRPLDLLIPVSGIRAAQLSDTFTDARGQGRSHDAIDIMAATGTPVLAVGDGSIVKLFDSKPGGHTIYQFDASGELAYYYAHLDRYAAGIAEGSTVKRGDLLGYVGYSGNASPQAPHLHFAIMLLGPEKKWWQGTAINPYSALGGR